MHTYQSPLRQAQAEQTRKDIVRAARRLFTSQGYAQTSMEQIAAEAGVAVQTIYARIGSKTNILSALNDVVDEDTGLGDLVRQLRATTDPHEVLRLCVRVTRSFADRAWDVFTIFTASASAAPEVSQFLAEGRSRHREGVAWCANILARLGALRADMPVERAAQVLTAYTWPDVYFHLQRDFGLSLDDAEEWTIANLALLLLREGGAPHDP